MEVKLLTSPASFKDMENFAALAALTCHANAEKPYIPQEVLCRIISKGHESILEHITLTYSVKGLSRACLQELARHRHISLSVESTRHTLRKNVNNPEWWHKAIEGMSENSFRAYMAVKKKFLTGLFASIADARDDEVKYFLPEMWPTNLILTSNIRELRHILKLRTNPAALNEFRVLAYSLFDAVPESFKYLLEDCVYREKSDEHGQE